MLRCVLVGLSVSLCQAAQNVKCFEGQVTYCGINADGGGIAPPGRKRYAEGINWACGDQLSNLDPTYIAPNCHDKESCEALQTGDIDDPFAIEHASPYNYVANVGYLSAARSANGTATQTCSDPEHPACGLQTTLREATGKTCEQCYTRFRYTADIGAIYWKVFQIKKECIAPGDECLNQTGCWCTTEGPKYYTGGVLDTSTNLPVKGTENDNHCSPWAKSACRRKVYKCQHHPADYVITTFQDYDIQFCSIGSDEKECSGCVACTHEDCQQPVIHVSKLNLKGPDPFVGATDLSRAETYNCSVSKCGEAPRTCWNQTCAYTDDCWPQCDESIYQNTVPGANMGFYVGRQAKLVELVKCCKKNYCNFPNGASRTGMSMALMLLLSLLACSFSA